MAKANNALKFHVPMTEFAASLGVSKPTISLLAKRGVLPADVFTKSGRQLYVHTKNATAALKAAPMGSRGALPAWALKVGNKDAIAKQKALDKAAAKAA